MVLLLWTVKHTIIDDGIVLEPGNEQNATFAIVIGLLVIYIAPVDDVQGIRLVHHQLVHLGLVGPSGRGDHCLVRNTAPVTEPET